MTAQPQNPPSPNPEPEDVIAVGDIRSMGVDIVEVLEVLPRGVVRVAGDLFQGRVAGRTLGPALSDAELAELGVAAVPVELALDDEFACPRCPDGIVYNDEEHNDWRCHLCDFATNTDGVVELELLAPYVEEAEGIAAAEHAAVTATPAQQPVLGVVVGIPMRDPTAPRAPAPATVPGVQAAIGQTRRGTAAPVGGPLFSTAGARRAPAPPQVVSGHRGGQTTSAPIQRDGQRGGVVQNPTSSGPASVSNGSTTQVNSGPRRVRAEAVAPVGRAEGQLAEVSAPIQRPDDYQGEE